MRYSLTTSWLAFSATCFAGALGDEDATAKTAYKSTQDEQLFWGTYRPIPYVGLRSRATDSPLVGLMWNKPQSSGISNIRHECSYYDNMTKYGWEEHDGVSYAKQTIMDGGNGVELTVQWVKPSLDEDPNHWILRVDGQGFTPATETSEVESADDDYQDLSLIWYLATTNDEMATFDTDHIYGKDNSFGQYFVAYNEPDTNKPASYIDGQGNKVEYTANYFLAYTVDENDEYDAKKYYFDECKDKVDTTPPTLFDPSSLYRSETSYTGNLILMQRFYELPFSIDIHFGYRDSTFTKEEMDITAANEAFKTAQEGFDAQFQNIFVGSSSSSTKKTNDDELSIQKALRYSEKQVTGMEKEDGSWTDAQLATGKYALSNMLGSMTYMHGDRMVLKDGMVVKEANATLFTGVPDRPDHARGFMWDEGFHQHLISVWNMNLTMEIISSWFSQADQSTGWICREQMLGREIRAGAPPSSWAQITSDANPPSQHMLLGHLLDRYDSDPELKKESYDEFVVFLGQIYDNFKLNVEWFLTTQASEVLPDTFRWKGRTPTYCLASGMDDYPRAPILTTNEAHVDLQTWMIVSTRVLSRVATILKKDEDAAYYADKTATYTQVLHDNFWDESRQMWDDFYLDESGDKQFDGHTGYLNFWPFFLEAIETDDARFETTARKLIDPATGLWTDYGIRSLSKNDPYYMLGDDYWTSPIWMNINYLITTALHKYGNDESVESTLKGDIATAYGELRVNLINMIVNSYSDTGFIWEVYNDDTGAGMDNHPFTGWSALVTNLMAEVY